MAPLSPTCLPKQEQHRADCARDLAVILQLQTNVYLCFGMIGKSCVMLNLEKDILVVRLIRMMGEIRGILDFSVVPVVSHEYIDHAHNVL